MLTQEVTSKSKPTLVPQRLAFELIRHNLNELGSLSLHINQMPCPLSPTIQRSEVTSLDIWGERLTKDKVRPSFVSFQLGSLVKIFPKK